MTTTVLRVASAPRAVTPQRSQLATPVLFWALCFLRGYCMSMCVFARVLRFRWPHSLSSASSQSSLCLSRLEKTTFLPVSWSESGGIVLMAFVRSRGGSSFSCGSGRGGWGGKPSVMTVCNKKTGSELAHMMFPRSLMSLCPPRRAHVFP